MSSEGNSCAEYGPLREGSSVGQCSAVQCSAVQCSAVQCSAVQCSAVQCSAVQCSAVQCSAVQCTVLKSVFSNRKNGHTGRVEGHRTLGIFLAQIRVGFLYNAHT